MDTKLNRIEEKLDKVADKISSIDSTLARQEEQLSYHIKRTNLLEEAIKPIEKHVTMMNGALKLVGLLAMLGGIVEGLFVALEYFKK